MEIALAVSSTILVVSSIFLIALSIDKYNLEKENEQLRKKLSQANAKIAQNEDVIDILTSYTKEKVKTELPITKQYKREQKDVNEYDVPQETRKDISCD